MKNFSILLLFLGTVGFSQESVNSVGGEATGTGGSFSYSVGQVVYTTKSSASGILNEGVQQTYTVIDSTGSADELSIDLEMKVFPNPTLDQIQLTIADFDDETLSYVLMDASSKELLRNSIVSQTTSIDFSNFESGVYILHVNDTAGRSTIFKIIKQ